ncbi:hypothetical protein ES708_22906 [subsurface metagenome]
MKAQLEQGTFRRLNGDKKGVREMKKNISILLIILGILIVFSTLVFASETIDVKDYIEGKFPVIFNIYLASLGDLDEYEKEFIDLLQNLPEEEQKNFAKEIYDNGFSKEILERIKRESIETKIEEKEVEKIPIIDTGKWVYEKGINPINDKVVITFRLECEKNELDNPIFLILKKEGKTTTICIDWGVELRTIYRAIIVVWTRFGDSKASKSSWETYNAFKEIILESIFGIQPKVASQYTFYSGRKTRYIRKLMDNDRFVAEIKLITKMKLTAVFDIRGLKEAVEPYNDILNWIKE